MAKKHTDTVDLKIVVRERIEYVEKEMEALRFELKGCVNEKAQFFQFYTGQIKRVELELEYLKGLKGLLE